MLIIIMCNDIVLLKPTVDVTDARVCCSFKPFSRVEYADGMLVYILSVFLSDFKKQEKRTFTRWKALIVTNLN